MQRIPCCSANGALVMSNQQMKKGAPMVGLFLKTADVLLFEAQNPSRNCSGAWTRSQSPESLLILPAHMMASESQNGLEHLG